MRCTIAIFCLLFYFSAQLEISNITFVIISQNSKYNDQLTQQLKRSLREQSQKLQQDQPKIYISNKDFHTTADWTISPLILPILNTLGSHSKWVMVLEDRTKVSLQHLIEVLNKYDSEEELWIGHALHDPEATIIHHFAFHEDPTFFKYPNLGSGMALSVPLLKRLKTRLKVGCKPLDFHIDPAHEFALFVYDNGKGPMIQDNDLFCIKQGTNCATYPQKIMACGDGDISSVYFAIKTCQKFHDNRVEIVKKTWYKYTVASTFFSDFEDPKIPTTSLGVPNTEQGHCQKSMAILLHGSKLFEYEPKLQWLALVDDDTILSVSRIASLTACHKNTTEPLILGERYRFGTQGFNYPTGGAGILINRPAMNILAQGCNCPKPDAPDDMVLGACAEQHGINLVHIPQMHQARPADYAPGRLATNDAITFHKYWMIDPIETYQQLFSEDDQRASDKINGVKSEL